jgi:hypothetical protein
LIDSARLIGRLHRSSGSYSAAPYRAADDMRGQHAAKKSGAAIGSCLVLETGRHGKTNGHRNQNNHNPRHVAGSVFSYLVHRFYLLVFWAFTISFQVSTFGLFFPDASREKPGKIPNTKHQIPIKSQFSIPNDLNRFGILNFGHCDLFVFCYL